MGPDPGRRPAIRRRDDSAERPARDWPMAEQTRLTLDILTQPDDTTCGPTCLHAVYRFYGDTVSLADVIASAPAIPGEEGTRGTLAVMLGCDALRRGYRARLYTFNLNLFDPTWFAAKGDRAGDPETLREKLRAQLAFKERADPRLRLATDSYLEFLDRGGKIWLRDLSSRLISTFLRRRRPILTGLSATYLYRCAREWGPRDDYDDVRGEPQGHFVVLCGYDPESRRVQVADPMRDNPAFKSLIYEVPIARLVAAIMLGVLTYDANLLVIEPADDGEETAA
ncbi:MAG: hypothetical protein ACF8R7_14095 [Phycisphaerales bacterium JB039]